MRTSIALTRIHTPEDYWERMACAEQVLHTYIHTHVPDTNVYLCRIKATELSDRYHEHWTMTRKDYFG